MNKIVRPLGISASAPDLIGRLRCFSIHNRVINLVNEQQKLITLHCHHNGISPMGYVIKKSDFLDLKDLFLSEKSIDVIQEPQGIVVDDICITNDARKLELTIKHKFISSFTFVDSLVHKFNQNTGLFGSLKSIQKDKLPPELHYLSKQVLLLLNNQSYDFSSIIGLGPGLTPTGDDILTGIFLMIRSDPFCSQLLYNCLSDFNLPLLEYQTTKVSANFLYYAARGIFSANLLNVLHLIHHKQNINITPINRLLNYGHTSGADILLGIWLGALILEQYKYG